MTKAKLNTIPASESSSKKKTVKTKAVAKEKKVASSKGKKNNSLNSDVSKKKAVPTKGKTSTKTNNMVSVPTSKKKVEKVEKNEKKNKGIKKMCSKVVKFLTKHKILVIASLLVIVVAISLYLFLPVMLLNKNVITIDGKNYTQSDYMIYLYSVKYNYFGKDNTNVTEATLNTQVSSTSNLTIREYLKESATNQIKTAAAIEKIARENNVTLSEKDLEELKVEKQNYIASIGGRKKFKKMLKDNNTSEESYDNMAYNDKLYNEILEELYYTGKKYDLTAQELIDATNEYYSSYYKFSQIILATIDLDTNQSLSTTSINQKESLARIILEEAKSGANFEELITKYSENANELEPPYFVYYKKGELLKELENAVASLSDNSISEVIKTDYALHIIKKETLDDGKIEDFYNYKREEKLLKNISDNIGNLSIIYLDSFNRIKIK